MPQNFTKEQMDALKQFVSDTIERKMIYDSLRKLETRIENTIGGRGSYITDSKLEKLLNSDVFKQPEPEAPSVKGHIDLSKDYNS
jgi:hypothetical protein